MDSFIDYGRSFIQTRGPENAVRFVIESRLEIIDSETGEKTIFYQAASCKSEHTFAKKHLFHKQNYNFLPVFAGENIIIFRSHVPWNENYVTVADEKSDTRNIWGKPEFLLRIANNVKRLEKTEEIIEATHKGLPITGRTEIVYDNGINAIIEYPVKTMNTNVDKKMYQVDTGPLLFPHPGRKMSRLKDFVSIAYIAFNTDYFADFIIEKRTALADGICVPHFSGIIENVPCKNFLYAMNSER